MPWVYAATKRQRSEMLREGSCKKPGVRFGCLWGLWCGETLLVDASSHKVLGGSGLCQGASSGEMGGCEVGGCEVMGTWD